VENCVVLPQGLKNFGLRLCVGSKSQKQNLFIQCLMVSQWLVLHFQQVRYEGAKVSKAFSKTRGKKHGLF
jgi:hypothetical protein